MPYFHKKISPKVFVIGLDGVPYTFLVEKIRKNELPNMQNIFAQGTLRQMTTVLPPISTVAWSTFATGVNPARHRIFGFTDRKIPSMEIFIPTAAHRTAPTLWQILSKNNKKVGIINVPCTYPPEPVNGFLVSCFLATDLNKATYPPNLAAELKKINYIIDVDTWKVQKDRDALLDDLNTALQRRLIATLSLMKSYQWDFFMTHVMETDRINHFFWEYMETNDPQYGARVHDFYSRIDAFVGEIYANLPRDTILIMLSDHGFCTLKKEVYVNYFLKTQGLLYLKNDEAKSPVDILPGTISYSLLPGRIFINCKGREALGSVEPGSPTEKAKKKTIDLLSELRDPDTNEPVVREIYRREDVYNGKYLDEAADIIAIPHNGYDLKGNFDRNVLTAKDSLRGMHTHDDAFLFATAKEITTLKPNIIDVAPSILQLFNIHAKEMEGKVCFQ